MEGRRKQIMRLFTVKFFCFCALMVIPLHFFNSQAATSKNTTTKKIKVSAKKKAPLKSSNHRKPKVSSAKARKKPVKRLTRQDLIIQDLDRKLAQDKIDNKALDLVKAGRLTEAEAMCLDSIKRDPKNEWAHATLGLVYIKMSRFPEARETYRTLRKLDAKMAERLAYLIDYADPHGPVY